MSSCPNCGRPVKRALLPEGGTIVLDDSVQPVGPGRFYIDYEQGPKPVAIAIPDARQAYGNVKHELVCGKPGSQ